VKALSSLVPIRWYVSCARSVKIRSNGIYYLVSSLIIEYTNGDLVGKRHGARFPRLLVGGTKASCDVNMVSRIRQDAADHRAWSDFLLGGRQLP
jgi:hypothetical protein